MPRYKLTIEYEGTAYSGWQIQPNVPTIEETLEQAFSQILQEKIDVVGQGRTDSGVHAEAQIAHCDIEQEINIEDLLYALLGVLPRDISVYNIARVDGEFHARFDGIWRQYRYQFVTRPSPFYYRWAELLPYDLDWPAMHECAEMLAGEHNFESFCKTDKSQHNALCTVKHSKLRRNDYLVTYRIRSNRFVHHMVRRIVGTMALVGTGKRTVEEFHDLLHQPSANKISHGASAKGLILEKVKY